MKTLHGTIHGKIIELQDDPGLPQGVEVEVVLRPAAASSDAITGLLRCAGALADDWTAEDDRILDELEKDRARSAQRELPK